MEAVIKSKLPVEEIILLYNGSFLRSYCDHLSTCVP